MSAQPWPGVVEAFRPYLPLPPHAPPVTLLEGNTPLLPAPNLAGDTGVEVYLKLEALNPTGSFKDRGMTVAVTAAVAQGAKALVCASTGNTAASAAAYAARAGLPAAVLLPQGAVAAGKLLQAKVAGAHLVTVRGSFDQALEAVRRWVQAEPRVALVNSVNPLRLEGQKTAALEVVKALGGAPDALVLPVGNAGNISAYHMGFLLAKELGWISRLPRLYGVQAEGAAPLVRGHEVDRPVTVASAIRIGRPVSAALARRAQEESGGRFLMVTDQEILEAHRDLPRLTGVFAEPASAASLAGLRRLLALGALSKGERVVLVLTGHGLKDPDTAQRSGEGEDEGPSVTPEDVPRHLEALWS